MVSLADGLNHLAQERLWAHVRVLSMARFDHQTTTKFHLDGAPEESVLMLGYEPTTVASSLNMADYSRAAADRGVSPEQFLAEFNPMFPMASRHCGIM